MDLGVRVWFFLLADDGRRIVDPRTAANVKSGGRTQSVGEGGVAAVSAGNSEGVVFANRIVRAVLVVRRQVAISEVVAGHVLVAGVSSTLENGEGEAWQSRAN